ncbi:MAG: hypothetical protein ABW221_02460 [Vicinamibacteria bacterium]
MKTITKKTALALSALLACAAGVRADDIWDLPNPSDDGCADTINELVHGARQVHDLQGGGATFLDADWARVQQRKYRSYEVRYTNSPIGLAASHMPALHTCAGVVKTGVPYDGGAQDAASLRWLSTGDGDIYARVRSTATQGNLSLYEVQLFETTYSVPRFNNSATQQTVLVVQNTRADAVNGEIHFFDAGGTAIHTHPFVIAARGVLVLNTAGIAQVAGQSGSLLVAHDGGYGALSGKAVALEPATGFTFDTFLTPKPY